MTVVTQDRIKEMLGLENQADRGTVIKALGGKVNELVDSIVSMATNVVSADPIDELETITEQELVDGLLRIPVSSFATLGTFTTIKDSDLKKPKTNGTSGQIQKLSVAQYVINGQYARMVNNRMAKECEEGEMIEDRFNPDEFVAEPHRWADRVTDDDGNPVGLMKHRNTGKLYVCAAHIRTLGKTYWYFGGKPVEYSEIADYFHPKRESGRQPQENKVKWRTIALESIQTVSITPNTNPRITHRYAVCHQ